MFKFTFKLVFSSLALGILFMLIGSDKAAAAAWDSCFFGNGDDFGVTVTGQHSNEMGGLKVQAQYASGAPMGNVDFTLKSDVPGKSGNITTPNGNVVDVDARIFAWPLGGGRSKEKKFTIGENLSPGSFNCPGKTVLGPGIPGERGNQWVLDCQEENQVNVNFWIDSIQNPGGQKGTWTYLFEGQERTISTPFIIYNGDNVRIDLIFTPEEPAGKIQSVECDRVRLIGYYTSDPSRYVKFLLLRGNGSMVVDAWTNKANQPHWYNTGLGDTFSAAYPGNVTLRLLIDTGGGVYQQVDSWQGSKSCSGGDIAGNCTHIHFTIPNDSKTLDSDNDWNTPDNQSYYAVYVNDWGTAGRPAAAGSPDYYPNGSGSPAGSGRYNDAPGPGVDYSSYDNNASESVGEGAVIDRNLVDHNKVVSGQLVWTVVVYDWFKNSSGNWRIQVQYRDTVETNNCFQADCSIDINGNVPGREGSDAMIAGSVMRGTVRIRNTGQNNLPSWMVTNSGTFGLSLTTDFRGGLSPNHLNENIPPGGQIERPLEDFGMAAPNDVAGHTISFYPDYWGRAGIGGWCSKNFRTFKEFNLSPTAGSISLQYNGVEDIEDPDTAVFNSSVSNIASNPATVNIPVTRTLTKNGANYPPSPWTSSPGMGNVTFNDSAGISGSVLGDEYCGRISVSPVRGWEGPGDRVVLDNGPRTALTCNDIANRPYMRAYGADVIAGSRFRENNLICNPNVNQIRGYTSSHADKSGTGGQLAAIAMSTIENFRTASLRSSNPTAPNGLSFGNTPAPVGQYAGAPVCATDFFNETQSDDANPSDDATADKVNKNTVSSGNLNPNSFPTFEQTLRNGNMALNGASGFNRKKIIYVDGDVRITGNISYAAFSTATNAPAFMLVARGNIYIANNVTRLDGIYVAQQKADGTGGAIYTCAKPGLFEGYVDGSMDMFNNCGGPQGETASTADDRKLVVNGAFIAYHIKFDRIHKSLRDSRSNTQELTGVSQGSEIFNYSPELYLSPPPFAKDPNADNEGPYYTTLPPIL